MTIGYSFDIWVPLLLYQTVDAPQWKTGWPASLAFSVGLWACFILATVLWRREYVSSKMSMMRILTSYSQRREAAIADTESIESSDAGSSEVSDEKNPNRVEGTEISANSIEEVK